MTEEKALYIEIGRNLQNSEESQMFGKPCFKINGKAFIAFFQEEMVFKLTGDPHRDVLSLDGSKLFDPSGKGRAMKEWVQVPFEYSNKWAFYAKESIEYVGGE